LMRGCLLRVLQRTPVTVSAAINKSAEANTQDILNASPGLGYTSRRLDVDHARRAEPVEVKLQLEPESTSRVVVGGYWLALGASLLSTAQLLEPQLWRLPYFLESRVQLHLKGSSRPHKYTCVRKFLPCLDQLSIFTGRPEFIGQRVVRLYLVNGAVVRTIKKAVASRIHRRAANVAIARHITMMP
jgi:hypothetical protein